MLIGRVRRLPSEFDASLPRAGPADLALLMYTSGTTGRPKAVPLTHGNIYAESDKVEEVMQITDREVVLSLLPLFHAYSQVVNLWLATIIGAQVVYLSELSSAGIERGLRESGATALTGVPRLWYLFHKKIFDAVGTKPAPNALAVRGASYFERVLTRLAAFQCRPIVLSHCSSFIWRQIATGCFSRSQFRSKRRAGIFIGWASLSSRVMV